MNTDTHTDTHRAGVGRRDGETLRLEDPEVVSSSAEPSLDLVHDAQPISSVDVTAEGGRRRGWHTRHVVQSNMIQ